MTIGDKTIFLQFVTRTGMYIAPQDKYNIVSFITGYEIGATCHFSESFEGFIEDNFKIGAGATGWPGQIELLSEKIGQSWIRTFKNVSLQFIVDLDSDDLNDVLIETVKTKVDGLIKSIDEKGGTSFNEWWTEEWMALCLINFDWFKNLWTSEELKVIHAIHSVVSSGRVFSEKNGKLPSVELIQSQQSLPSGDSASSEPI